MRDALTFKYAPSDLLERIRANREQHVDDFEGAMKGYLIEVDEQLNEVVKNAKATRKKVAEGATKFDRYFAVDAHAPESHVEEYDRIIDMLEMTKDEVIELDEQDFAKYVRDEWTWKREFAAQTAFYNAKVRHD